MKKEFLTPDELKKITEVKIEISKGDYFFVAIMKKGGKDDTIQVCQNGIGEWIEIPLKMIESAKIVGSASGDGNKYQVALIKLNEPNEPFLKVAYQLLTQINTTQVKKEGQKDCGCNDEKSETKNGTTSTSRLIGNNGNFGGIGGLGMFGIGGGCHFEFKCYSCTRCIPFTDVCWDSTCCDLVAVDCDIRV